VIIQWLCEVDMLHEAKTTSATDCSNVRSVAVCFACRTLVLVIYTMHVV